MEPQAIYTATRPPKKDDPFEMRLFGLAMEIHQYRSAIALQRSSLERLETKCAGLTAEFDRLTGAKRESNADSKSG